MSARSYKTLPNWCIVEIPSHNPSALHFSGLTLHSMRALLCKSHGLPETLVVEELPTPVPGPGQLCIDVKAAGVNFPDALIIQNKYQLKPTLPFAPGAELAGVVSAIGPGVTRFKVGDTVCGACGFGAFAEDVVVDAERMFAMPVGVSFDVAASFILAYGTSHHALIDRGELRPGETVVVLGAAGGVGLAAVEIAKAVGARVIACASNEEKLALCRSRGADETINYTSEDLKERIRELTKGEGADVIYDPVGGGYAEPALRSIGWRGRYLVVGFANGEIPRIPLNLALLKGCSIVGVYWGAFASREPSAAGAAVRQLFDWLAEGKLRPEISGRYELANAPQALRAMLDRKVTGKVVVLPEA